jgi:cytochrome c-type biogenesis protein CcmH
MRYKLLSPFDSPAKAGAQGRRSDDCPGPPLSRGNQRRGKAKAILFLLLGLTVCPLALAVEPSEMLKDPALEARARAISEAIRCVVCQNQSIDDSAADLAGDLRRLVRERLTAGDSDQQVRDYLVARYGDFVLLDPPVKPKTYLLWYGPGAIFLLGLAATAVYFRRRRSAAQAPSPLSADEAERLQSLLAADGERRGSP